MIQQLKPHQRERLDAFWDTGMTLRWSCPECGKKNNVRVVDEKSLFGDKCDCETRYSKYKRCEMKLAGVTIMYLTPRGDCVEITA